MLGFTLALSLPFLGKPLHNDEPVFAAVGRHILNDPLHPLGFDYYWFGSTLPMKRINTTPPGFHYLMALDCWLSGGREWLMRLVFLPFSLAAAWALYGLASRFLERPLLPALIVVACPAFIINMGHLMPEAPSVALGLAGLWAAVKGADAVAPARRAGTVPSCEEGEWDEGGGQDDSRACGPRAWWLAAALLGASVLFKYNAALFIPAALCYAASRAVPRARLAAFAALAAAPAGLILAGDLLGDRAFAARAWEVTAQSASGWWSSLSHKARSFLAFTGGCALVTGLWPYLAEYRRGLRAWHGLAAAAVVALFLPAWDLAHVRLVDRTTGIVLSLGASLGLVRVFLGRGEVRGSRLWLPWLASAAVFQAFLYWSVMARTILHMTAPMVFALAAGMEALLGARASKRLAWASLCVVTALSLALASVDYRYATATKSFAEGVARTRLEAGRTVYFTGAMGLQYYLEKAGAKGLEVLQGGWDRVRPGESVVVLRINSVRSAPSKPRLADEHRQVLDHPMPLRLMSGWEGEGGFYSNLSGFLPFSISRESLEEFSVVEMR